MLSLRDRLRERIRSEGAITFYEFMKTALYDADAGYYCRERLRWGREGDYRTSPERSILFAATFARYFVELFRKLGAPAGWTIVEAGAGSGEFAAGVLETLRLRSPDVFAVTRYVIDERSSSSRKMINTRVASLEDQVQFARIEDLETFPAGIVFSNELLDAFPVHRVMKRDGELVEYYVSVNDVGNFTWEVREPSSSALPEYLTNARIDLAEGQSAEVNLEIKNWLARAVKILARGYLVTVDYGARAEELFVATDRPEGTLRGFSKHKFTSDVLANPGEQDITSSVDWSEVIRAGRALGFRDIVFERQDRFLMNAGLLEELELRVTETDDQAEKLRLRTSVREFVLPSGMAASFQVLVQEKL